MVTRAISGPDEPAAVTRFVHKAIPILLIAIFSCIIYGGVSSESADKLTWVLVNLDTNKVRSVEIDVYSDKYKLNLVGRPITITQAKDLNRIIGAFKGIRKGHLIKGTSPFWECYLRVNFDSSYQPPLKHPAHSISVWLGASGETCYIGLLGTMGGRTYASDSMKTVLEHITKFKSPAYRYDH